MGFNAGANLTTGHDNVDIQALGVAGESNTMRIGTVKQTATYIAGISGATVATGATVIVGSDGHLGTVTSSERFKEAIYCQAERADADDGLHAVRTYRRGRSAERRAQCGAWHRTQCWNGGGAISHTVAPTTNATYTATFKTQYFLTMAHGTGGTVTPASGWRNAGAAISINAMPATGYSFTNWAGSGTGSFSGTNNPASITMGGPITETATFTHN